MNAIYAKQVKDILDYDNNINKQLVRVEKKQIKRWDDGAPDLMPYMQIEMTRWMRRSNYPVI